MTAMIDALTSISKLKLSLPNRLARLQRLPIKLTLLKATTKLL